jgi:hypothetical protein
MTTEPITVTVKEAAAMIGLERAEVYDLLNKQLIEGRYYKSRRLVLVSSLRAYIEGLPTERDAS